MLEEIDPIHLISASRLDCVVKYDFFRSLMTGMDVQPSELRYRWHVAQRTGGREPADFHGRQSAKTVVDDYVVSARSLLESMRVRGFDKADAVPVGSDGLLLDGAHRVAAAAALGLPISIERHERPGYSWDFSWFKDKGANKANLGRLLHSWVRLKSDSSVFIFWGPVLHHWESMQAALLPEFEVVGGIDLAFGTSEAAAFQSLVLDCYALDTQDLFGMINYIGVKAERLTNSPMFIRIVVGRTTSPNVEPSLAARAVKERLRDMAHPSVDRALFMSCHASSSYWEALYLAEIFLNPVNIAHVRLRRSAKPRDQFITWCESTRKKVLDLGLTLADVCVVGSGPLEAVGLRNATDIDITLRSSLRRRLFDAEVTHVQKDLDVVTEGYHRTADRPWISDDHLIESPENHFTMLGLKFASLSLVCDRKRHSGRAKDLLDVELLGRFVDTRSLRALSD